MTGVVAIDKPEGFTSFDVVAKCRGILKERRIGHSGTLDPLATGVLPVFVGRATRAVDILPDTDKSYVAGFKLGFSTDTQDTTGEITAKSGVTVSESEVAEALSGFLGEQLQLPPMYSAVRVGGKRLYELARAGKTVERQPRRIEIYGIRLLNFDENTQSGELSVDCSKGTYIRTLINDLGERLGALGAMSALRRTRSQGFTLEQCVTLDQLEAASASGCLGGLILPVESCFLSYPEIRLSQRAAERYKNGVTVSGIEGSGLVRVYSDGGFLGLGSITESGLKTFKGFWEI